MEIDTRNQVGVSDILKKAASMTLEQASPETNKTSQKPRVNLTG